MNELDLAQIAIWLFFYVLGFGAILALVHWWEGRKNNFDDY